MGTGVVAFNLRPRRALLCDSNPHLIRFYQALQRGEISKEKARSFLTSEGDKLLMTDGDYYYTARDRFNLHGEPLDFLFLSRSCFNGMMRFNRRGEFNVPFCRKPNRFARALITKVCNQIEAVSHILQRGDYELKRQEFRDTVASATQEDLIYCDPPYIGRHTDYFNSWSAEDEKNLRDSLLLSNAKFIMSTWLRNKYRANEYVFSTWRDCSISTRQHFYHVGAKEENRNAVVEALITNFNTPNSIKISELPLQAQA